MTHILMVCLGNICRSPLAEGLLQSKLPESRFRIDSAGTSSYHIGESPDNRSIAIAQENGIDIREQRARNFTYKDFATFDLILTMDQANYRDVMAMARSEMDRAKVKLILDYLPDDPIQDVPDPYYGGTGGFQLVYNLLDRACENLAHELLYANP